MAGMEPNPYEAPKTPEPADPADLDPKAEPRFSGYEVALLVLVVVFAVWTLLGAASVGYAQWHSRSNVQTAAPESRESP